MKFSVNPCDVSRDATCRYCKKTYDTLFSSADQNSWYCSKACQQADR